MTCCWVRPENVRPVHAFSPAADGMPTGQLGRQAQVGPSPRAWGFHERVDTLVDVFRSISTRVGIPSPTRRSTGCAAVHPHARGDSCSLSIVADALDGPPPRAWGFQVGDVAGRGQGRSIPPDDMAPGQVGPSPRAWGFPVPPPPSIADCGRSPRAWGFRDDCRLLIARVRSIPTRVGIPASSPGTSSRTVHPHARGDSASRRLTTALQHRRSIPTRVGIPTRRRGEPPIPRSIPTRVGIPRSRPSAWLANGPSPRAWGFRLRLSWA